MPSLINGKVNIDVQICGDDLVSVSIARTRDAAALASALRQKLDVTEVVPGIESVVVQFDSATVDGEFVNQQIRAVINAGVREIESTGPLMEIPVVYGGDAGPDFNDVCKRTGLSATELIELHTGREYSVELIGFTPGFAFIGELDERLNIPRRSEPRQRVPAGSVGIADGRTGLYALPVPGGWSLIGRTEAQLFDPTTKPPNRLDVGTRIRFVAIDEDEANQ